MCKCTPELKTPWCGKTGCEEPSQESKFLDSKEKTHSAKEIYDLGFKAGVIAAMENLWREGFMPDLAAGMKAHIERTLHRFKEGKIG